VRLPFRWNADNVDHIGEHGVRPADAEHVLSCTTGPFPRSIGGGKHLVWGQAQDGRFLQVIFIYSPPGVVYVIHARTMTDREKRRFRSRRP
jgi:uncharacterized DUF497 family protein